MELRDLSGRFGRIVTWMLVGLLTLTAVYTLSRMTLWQNSIRLLMEMEPIDSAYPLTVTHSRNPDTPQWRPIFRDSAAIR